MAVFIRAEPSHRLPRDLWVQALTMETQEFADAPKKLNEVDEDLTGLHDVAVLFHVDAPSKGSVEYPTRLLQ